VNPERKMIFLNDFTTIGYSY